jgi:hypothetical protein
LARILLPIEGLEHPSLDEVLRGLLEAARDNRGLSTTRLETSAARLMEMRGRPMRGWLRIDAEDVGTKRELKKWVERGTTYARSLPAKG